MVRRSSFRLLGSAVRQSARAFWPILKASWISLTVIFVLETACDQYFDYLSDFLTRRGTEKILLIAGSATLQMVAGLIWAALWLLAVVPAALSLIQRDPSNDHSGSDSSERAHGLSPKSHSEFLSEMSFARRTRIFLNQMLIEETRAFAAILRRLPLLLFPAIIEYLRLSLVSYVVVLEPSYNEGKADALNFSRSLTRGRWLLLAVLLLFTGLTPWGLKQWIEGDSGPWIWENPTRVTLSVICRFVVELMATLIFYFVYRDLSSELSPPLPRGESDWSAFHGTTEERSSH